MKGDVEEIMKNVESMRDYVLNGQDLGQIVEKFKEFKEECPKLFEMVLENKPGYYQELQNMVSKARGVKAGSITLENATKIIKNKFDSKYIYPTINRDNLTYDQKQETDEYIKNQKLQAEVLEDSLKTVVNKGF
jgi:hypothetical protein